MNSTAQLLRVGRYDVALRETGFGVPLVFLHGFSGAPAEDAAFIHELAKSRRVIIPSHPGFDGSSDDIAIQNIHNVVIFYQELLDLLGLSDVDMLGHSLGGMFAAELAAAGPGLVRRLVLAAPLGLWVDESPVPDFMSSGGNALMRLLWANPEAGTPPPSGTATEEAAQSMVAHTANLSAATHYLWPLPDRGLKHRIHRVKAPTLLLWGDQDNIVGMAHREAFHRHIPGSQIEVVSDAGHMLLDEQPAAAVRATLEFLK